MASGPGHGGSIFSSDLGYGGSSTAALSTYSTSHMVERYHKMAVQPHDEGKLYVYLTGLPRTDQGLLIVFCTRRSLPEPERA